MSFARRVLVIALVIQVLGSLAEIAFAIGLQRYVEGLAADPAFAATGLALLAGAALIVPVYRGNRWAILAALPALVLLLLAAMPVFGAVFGSPSLGNFLVWLTLTVMIVSAASGVPFGILASLEAFGRRDPVPAVVGESFSLATLFLSATTGAIVGMTVLAVAVAANPGNAGLDGAPDEFASVVMADLRFEPAQLALAGGSTTAVFVINEDAFDHSFDIDELDLHVIVPGGQTRVVLVTPASGAALDVYCAIPGHTESGMVGRLVAD